jgi:hypothetical protein
MLDSMCLHHELLLTNRAALRALTWRKAASVEQEWHLLVCVFVYWLDRLNVLFGFLAALGQLVLSRHVGRSLVGCCLPLGGAFGAPWQ